MKYFIIIVLCILSLFLVGCSSKASYDLFATCLTENGVKMYGAFWCSHCTEQKKLFGDSFQYVNYVECSLPDGKSQTELCSKEEISSYPTWELGDGTRFAGVIGLEDLSQRTNCSLQ
ncbi:hypothetical protein J4210_03925 [Candidatus Woesearchaeota archaeon]|nr:hypothetical protein [Candidatus Woesearchaeota archaeon]